MKYVDTHAHLYDEAFEEDRTAMVARAVESGVERLLLPDVDSRSRADMLRMAEEYPANCYAMVGLHPTSVNDFADSWREEIEMVRAELACDAKRFVAVGEIGMDLYWSQDFEAQQREALRMQLDMALEYSLPVVLHVRDAWEAILEVLADYKGRGLRGVIHAFSGDLESYNVIKECGDFLFAIGGVVTFKKSKLAEVVAQMDLADLLLETDSPYLTPTPHRGKRNESAYIPLIGQFIAQLKGVEAAEVAKVTTRNAERMFGL